MPTFITVIDIGGDEDPYLAVKACHHEEPIMRDGFFNSRFNQAFPKTAQDQSLGTKTITDIKTERLAVH